MVPRVRVSNKLRDQGEPCKSVQAHPLLLQWSAAECGVRRYCKSWYEASQGIANPRFLVSGTSLAFLESEGARSYAASANPPDKSTPGVIRGRKTRGLI